MIKMKKKIIKSILLYYILCYYVLRRFFMKNLKLLLLLILTLLILPFAVNAEETESSAEESSKEVEKVNVYFFRGEGCSYCAAAEEWFDEISDEYGDKFKVVDYETWNSQENMDLMNEVAKARGETADGVPYIIVGNKSWNGFADDYKESIISQIEEEYKLDADSRYDIMQLIDGIGNDDSKKDSTGSDVLFIIISVIILGVVGFGLYKVRQSSC